MLEDLLAGKTKFHNVFHYPTRSWADVGIIAWLVDAAAIVSQQALRDSSYAPYARTMRKICWEESVHIMHGRDVVLTLMNGTDAQRAMVQEALDRWWGPLMQMHGPPTDPAKDKDLHWGIKSKNNEQLRQEFLSIYVPRIRGAGTAHPGRRPAPRRGHRPLGVHGARLGRAEVGRHRPRAGVAVAPRVPARELRRDPVGPRRVARERDRRCLTRPRPWHATRARGRLQAMSERVWEVFRQEDEGDPMIHAGNVNAPDEELALHYAREFYGRRGESHRLWIVPRDSITELDGPGPAEAALRPQPQEAGRLSHQAQAGGREAARRDGGLRMTATPVPLDIAARDALAELILSAADDEFVIGFWDSEWTGIAPMLEEDVATSSIAQDEIGHARALYELLAELTDDDPDRIAYGREPADYRHAALLNHARGDWAFTVARRYLYETADAVRLAAFAALDA